MHQPPAGIGARQLAQGVLDILHRRQKVAEPDKLGVARDGSIRRQRLVGGLVLCEGVADSANGGARIGWCFAFPEQRDTFAAAYQKHTQRQGEKAGALEFRLASRGEAHRRRTVAP